MKIFFFTFFSLLLSQAAWSTSYTMKMEGSCSGKLANGAPVSFDYFSNFNGCRNSARAAIAYRESAERMQTGLRSFTASSDIFTFGKTRLVFANSTGNTSGKFSYIDSRGKRRTVVLQCDVRDYEYGECE